MISKDEISSIANETGLTPYVVEKDYILGWVLAGIFENPLLQKSWTFKGGTCLKKCYFETYRFSEDLDFTLQSNEHLEVNFLIEQFTTISGWLYENVGIEIPVDRFIFDIYKETSCEGRIYYRSYYASGKLSMPKVKLDLTTSEILVMPPAKQKIFHNFSDDPSNGNFIECYTFEELFAEKIRALGERGRPRDLYDVINLYRSDQLPAHEVLKDILTQKCAFKGIEIPNIDIISGYHSDLASNWEPMLKHQLPFLPSLEVYWRAIPDFFSWLEGKEIMPKIALTSVTSEGEIYRPLYGHLGLRTIKGKSLEIIRFASGNRLCVDLKYQGTTRRIEPYSLRRTKSENILLYAVKSQTGETRSYRVDRIEGASVTNQVFTPRYQVELSPDNQLIAPKTTGTSTT